MLISPKPPTETECKFHQNTKIKLLFKLLQINFRLKPLNLPLQGN